MGGYKEYRRYASVMKKRRAKAKANRKAAMGYPPFLGPYSHILPPGIFLRERIAGQKRISRLLELERELKVLYQGFDISEDGLTVKWYKYRGRTKMYYVIPECNKQVVPISTEDM